MEINVWMIPDYKRLEQSVELAKKYNAKFDYFDFSMADVYMNDEEVEKRINKYLSLGRDTSQDTMHGVYIDMTIHSADPVIAKHSRFCIYKSMHTAKKLGVKGIVFHTGLIGGLKDKKYMNNWLKVNATYFKKVCQDFPDIQVYMENMFELDYELLEALSKAMRTVPNFGVCLNYGHAALSDVEPQEWLFDLAGSIKHMYISDNDLRNDHKMVLGEGKIDFSVWKRYMENLKCQGDFEEYPSLVIENRTLEEFEASMEYLRNL